MKTQNTKNQVHIDEFRALAVHLTEYVSTKNSFNNKAFRPRTSVKLGKKLTKAAKTLIKTDLVGFLRLLDDGDLVVAQTAATYLYPLYPNKCVAILERYLATLEEPLDRFPVENAVEGYKKELPFFTEQFCKLFSCRDWHALNRESLPPPQKTVGEERFIDREFFRKCVDEWDPMGLYPACPKGEYDEEIDEILYFLGEKPVDVKTLRDFLRLTFWKYFGDSFTRTDEECRAVAEKILKK